MNGALLSSRYIVSHLCCVSSYVLFRGVAPLFIHEGEAVLWLFLERSPCTTAFYMDATATWRRGRAAPAGGWPPLVAGRPLTTASGHRLRVAGHGLDLHCSLMEFCYVWVELIDVFVIPLRNLVSESVFRWISYALIFVTCKTCLHQNLWKVWVKIPNSKFGVYLSIFIWKLAVRSWG
jgi:hypothetical protein